MARNEQAEVPIWMGPVLDALRKFGGSGSPQTVSNEIASVLKVPNEKIEEVTSAGGKRFHNQVCWARQYLKWEGYIESQKRGIWTLTATGAKKHLTIESSREIVKKWVKINSGREPKPEAVIETDDQPIDIYVLKTVDEINEPEKSVPLYSDTYTIEDILQDGCFIEPTKLENMLKRLRLKKNLILQGPPGTGKTWLAKRLAFAMIERRDKSKVRAIQFHPNLSYEDFVRGWRPTGAGSLSLVDGPFLETIKAALQYPTSCYVVVIEEINRGNPAQIFGEMLTLLEADKRKERDALELCYHQCDENPIYIPDNLYVIGTMNIADRSLALVDLALRRRFAFIDLEPIFGNVWKSWMMKQCIVDDFEILNEIEQRIKSLNNDISKDSRLGTQFRIGHSYVTPPPGTQITYEWFNQVVETEIGPLLDEYWFDAPKDSQKARQILLEGL